MPDRHMRVPSSDQVAEDKNKSGMWWLGRKAPHSGGPSSQLEVNVEKKKVFFRLAGLSETGEVVEWV